MMMIILEINGGTKLISRIMEQEPRLIFQEHDDDDEDDDPKKKWRDQINLQDQGAGNTHNTSGIM